MLPNTPRFVYGGTEFIPDRPARFWAPVDNTVGGMRIAGGGTPASYVARRDAMIDLTIRLSESQWPELLNLVIFGQSAQPFRWYPDALLTDEGTDSFLVYLQAPGPGERWSPTRLGDFPRVLEMTLTLRGAASVPWKPYF